MKAQTYTTGKPCKRGHIGPRYVKAQDCVECQRERVTAWAKANQERRRGTARARRRADPEKSREEVRRYRAEHPRHRAHEAAYRIANKARLNARSAAWAKANPERMRALQDAYHRAHPEKAREWQAEWRRANPAASRAIGARRAARKRSAPGRGVTPPEWQGILDASLGLCAYCNERRPLTLDHIEPLAHGGANESENVAAACKSCNSSKCDTPLLLWLAGG